MYILFIFLAAFFLLSIFTTNWPVKIYHHYLLTKIAQEFEAPVENFGFFFSKVFSQLKILYQGKPFQIRFLETAMDSLKSSSGLEIRLKTPTGTIIEFYRLRRNKREWGDFRRFLTGDELLDSQWFILTNDRYNAEVFWNSHSLKELLSLNYLEQLLINQDEIVSQLKFYHSPRKVKEFVQRLVEVFL